MKKLARVHAYVIEGLFTLEKADLHSGGYPAPKKTGYQSGLLKIMMGNN